MAIISEILRFVLPPTKAKTSEFLKLRQHLAKSHAVSGQYFGYVIPVKASAQPTREHEMCWVIQWPQNSNAHWTAQFKTQLNDLIAMGSSTANEEARSLLFPFEDPQIPELTIALDAPICEFALINLLPTTPRSDTSFRHSMHKTYTDCYLAPGFTGGQWSYASNTNDTNGMVLHATNGEPQEQMQVPEEDRRLACYYLGWESTEHHQTYTQTPLFFEEINKLAPYFGPGTGAWYAKFEKHIE